MHELGRVQALLVQEPGFLAWKVQIRFAKN